ncbi:MAG: hypothetical protein JSW11_13620 [Candidatus Heimdallarchaeota archaeon]|nr:MAG: hypothetical protein JSW11_13620 [Candidatus Heimdallarchaeota archaeon]
MGTLHEKYLQSIQTILNRVTPYIAKYPPSEQAFLTEFFSVLETCEVSTSEKRKMFSQLVDDFIKRNYAKNTYISLPFMWFAVDYLSTANRILSVAEFHPNEFYLYLVQHLRKNLDTQGIFRLIQAKTPLTSLTWETLQYACNKFTVPLTSDEVQTIRIISSHVATAGIRALSQHSLKKSITRHVKTPRFSQKLSNFLKFLNAQWTVIFYPPTIGLERLYFYFKLRKTLSISQILGYRDSKNMSLRGSNIYRIGNSQTYWGFLLIPSRDLEAMKNYLKHSEEEGRMILLDLARVVEIQISQSMTLYQEEKGWRDLTLREQRRINRQLRDGIPPENHDETPTFLISPPFDRDWHFNRNYKQIAKIIDLYCKAVPSFSFSELASRLYAKQSNFRFSKEELQLIAYLYHKKVLQCDFNPIRLISDFSLDRFSVQIPKTMKLKHLEILLSYLPRARVFTTETGIQMWTVLTPDLVHLLVQDLEWTVQPINTQYYGISPEKSWFDFQACEWKTPQILSK